MRLLNGALMSPLGTAVSRRTAVDFIQNTIVPTRWHSMQQTGGTNEPNRINPGTNDATISGVTLGQAGLSGANEAYAWGGSSGYVQMPAGADIDGALPATWIVLVYVNSRGEANGGRFFQKTNDLLLTINNADATSPYTINAIVNFSGGAVTATWSNVLPVSTWTMLALRINDDNTLDLLVNGAKQTTSAAGSGTKSSTTNPVYIGNNSGQSATMDGLMDEFIFENSAISDADLLTLAQLYGLA